MTARDEIVARIRAIPRNAPAPFASAYRTHSNANHADRIALFIERLAAYHVTVLRVPSESAIREAATAQLRARGIKTLVIPPELTASWRPTDPDPIEDHALPLATLDTIEGAMTGSFLAIAETGTVVLDAGLGQGRRALTLLPDYHLCVVRESDVVGIVPEAIAALHPRVTQGAPITFFSGPSATADIELDRVEGVHGPRVLDVILVGS